MKRGFTLVELIAVIAVIAMLSILVLPNFIGTYNTSVEKAMKTQENQIVDATKMFIEDYCRNPLGDNTGECSNYSLNVTNSDNTKKYTCLSDIQTKKYIEDINLDGVSCKGFILYDKEDNSKNYTNYKAYIQCGDGYQTEGIENIVDSTDNQIIEACGGHSAGSPYAENENYLVNETGTYYETLNDVFSNVSSNQTIKVLKNMSESSTATLSSSKTGIKLDLNGKTITTTDSPGILNQGSLTIHNTSSAIGTITSSKEHIIKNAGTLIVGENNDGNQTIIKNESTSSNSYAIYNLIESNLNIILNKKAKIISSNIGIYVGGKIVIDGATIIAKDCIVINSVITGNLTMNDGIINGTSRGISSNGANSITINGGTITGIIALSVGTVNQAFQVTINGGTITGIGENSRGIDAVGNGDIIINDGTISGNTGISIGDYRYNTRATVLGGKVIGNKRAIYVEGASTLTLGTDDETVSTTTPIIEKTSDEDGNGVYVWKGSNKGKFYYYDGIIKSNKGSNTSIYGIVTGTPEGYNVIKSLSGETETAVLGGNY